MNADSAVTENPVKITVFPWAGSWGPFKVNIPCGECALTAEVIKDTINVELSGIPVELETMNWLDNWWKPLLKGGWHAPIVLVEGRVVSQGEALNRGILTQAVISAHATKSSLDRNVVFGKDICQHCVRAKDYLNQLGVEYEYCNVVKDPRSMYEMLARVKPLIGPKTPVTVPQIWLDGEYVGGAGALAEKYGKKIEPNTDRGWCSISPGKLKSLQ